MQIQLEINDDKIAQVKRLMERTRVQSYSELFNTAVTLLQWCVQQVEDGRTILSVDDATGSEKELLMPSLQQADSSAEESEIMVSSRRRDKPSA